MKAYLMRLMENDSRTLGRMILFDGVNPAWSGVTLELPWKDNQNKKSCIPKGIYSAALVESPKFGKVFQVENVSGRSGILFHAGNYPKDTQGCILIGVNFRDLDGDREQDIESSRAAMKSLMRAGKNGFELEIV